MIEWPGPDNPVSKTATTPAPLEVTLVRSSPYGPSRFHCVGADWVNTIASSLSVITTSSSTLTTPLNCRSVAVVLGPSSSTSLLPYCLTIVSWAPTESTDWAARSHVSNVTTTRSHEACMDIIAISSSQRMRDGPAAPI